MVRNKVFAKRKPLSMFEQENFDTSITTVTARRFKVCSIFMGDSDDPYLTAAFPLSEWEKTDHGKFILEHAFEPPEFFCDLSHERMGYNITIYAYLRESDMTLYYLKYPNP